MNIIEKTCLSCIDLTSLNAMDTEAKIIAMAQKVNAFPEYFPHLPNVAAICVYPIFAGLLKQHLTAPGVKITVVGAGFPSSQTFPQTKADECRMAVEAGADEVDIVVSLRHFLAGKEAEAAEEIALVRQAIGKAHLKVILESGSLPNTEAIAQASRLSIAAGADFIKTSTGKSEPAATPEAARIMCRIIKEHFAQTGKMTGFKPAGGIVSVEDALTYYQIVKETLGEAWLCPEYFRIGASRLANNLLSHIEGTEIHYFV